MIDAKFIICFKYHVSPLLQSSASCLGSVGFPELSNCSQECLFHSSHHLQNPSCQLPLSQKPDIPKFPSILLILVNILEEICRCFSCISKHKDIMLIVIAYGAESEENQELQESECSTFLDKAL